MYYNHKQNYTHTHTYSKVGVYRWQGCASCKCRASCHVLCGNECSWCTRTLNRASQLDTYLHCNAHHIQLSLQQKQHSYYVMYALFMANSSTRKNTFSLAGVRNGLTLDIHRGPEKNCTKFNASAFCNSSPQNHAVCTKMLRKITVYQSLQNLCQLVKYSLINSHHWIHVNADKNDTSNSWRSTANWDFANWKRMDCRQNYRWDSSETDGNSICSLISYG